MVGFSRAWFVIAAAGLAILILAYGDFAPGGESLPAWIPRRDIWIYGYAVLVLAAGAGLCFSPTALPSAWTIGVYLSVWITISIPRVLSEPLGIGAWYPFCEALSSL